MSKERVTYLLRVTIGHFTENSVYFFTQAFSGAFQKAFGSQRLLRFKERVMDWKFTRNSPVTFSYLVLVSDGNFAWLYSELKIEPSRKDLQVFSEPNLTVLMFLFYYYYFVLLILGLF